MKGWISHQGNGIADILGDRIQTIVRFVLQTRKYVGYASPARVGQGLPDSEVSQWQRDIGVRCVGSQSLV